MAGHREGDVEVWYDSIKEHTFKTEFVELTEEGGRAFQSLYFGSVSEGETNLLAELEKKIDEKISGFENGAAFIRLSHLSPKDGVLTSVEKLHNELINQLKNVEIDRAAELVALNRAIYNMCKCTTGKQAIEMIGKSNRCYNHFISESTKCSKNNTPWIMNIVVREWNEIQPELEFRGFVFQKKLTAVTHYYKFCYMTRLVDEAEEISTLLCDYFATIADLLPDNCVLDFVITQNNQIKIVELNPWSIHASSALFSWETDIDTLEGRNPFEFRILRKPVANVFERLSPQLRMLLFMCRPVRLEEGRELERNEKRTIYNLPLSNRKKLTMRKLTGDYNLLNRAVNWDSIIDLANYHVYQQDNLPRCYWTISKAFFAALGSTVVIKPSRDTVSAHCFPTSIVIALYEIYFREKESTYPRMEELNNLLSAAYQFLFDALGILDQPAAIKNPNSPINLLIHNSCTSLSQLFNILVKK